MSAPGNLFIVAAPSGTGKTTLVKAVTEILPNVMVSISHTTRPKRPAETHGLNYYFIPEAEFQAMIAHYDFLEYAMVFDNYYGTSRTWVNQTLASGKDVILEIDWQGAQQIKALFPNSIGIFILPPSLSDLTERLLLRNQDKPDIIRQRLTDVREAVSHIHEFKFVIMNDNFDTAVQDLKTILEACRLLQRPQLLHFNKLIDELLTAK